MNWHAGLATVFIQKNQVDVKTKILGHRIIFDCKHDKGKLIELPLYPKPGDVLTCVRCGNKFKIGNDFILVPIGGDGEKSL